MMRYNIIIQMKKGIQMNKGDYHNDTDKEKSDHVYNNMQEISLL